MPITPPIPRPQAIQARKESQARHDIYSFTGPPYLRPCLFGNKVTGIRTGAFTLKPDRRLSLLYDADDRLERVE